MIVEKDTCLLKWGVAMSNRAIVHSCNCFHIQGGGIALRIKQTFPEAYEADLQTKKGDRKKLGTFSKAKTQSGLWVYNLYGQFDLGCDRRMTSYDALADGLLRIEMDLMENGILEFGLPCNMGSKLGGGSWHVVRAIIEDVFEESDITCHICKYEP